MPRSSAPASQLLGTLVVFGTLFTTTLYAQGFNFTEALQDGLDTNPDPNLVEPYRASSGDTHGPGAVFTDLDNDGDPDLVVVTGPNEPAYVFRNVSGAGGGRGFEMIQGLTSPGAGATGALAADYDNDGDADLYVLNHPFAGGGGGLAPNQLWQNQWAETGTLSFVLIASNATDPTLGGGDRQRGVSTAVWGSETLEWSLTAAWSDVDRDGDLDLFVGNHDSAIPVNGQPGPKPPTGERDVLYLNNGDGTFSDFTVEAPATGFETPGGTACVAANRDNPEICFPPGDNNNFCAGKGVTRQCYSAANAATFADANNDRWPDLIVTNKSNQIGVDIDMLYVNLQADASGAWRGFANCTYSAGDFAQTSHASLGTLNAMGIDAGDFDNDGDLDIYITDGDCAGGVCSAGPINNLYRNRYVEMGSPVFNVSNPCASVAFEDISDGVVGDVRADFSWGTQWLDADNDRDLDLHVATGGNPALPISDFLYLRNGSIFQDQALGLGVRQTENSRGDLTADWDRDGDVDLFVVNLDNRPSKLYRNNLATGTPGRNFLHLRLSSHPALPPGPFKSTRDAIGARVKVSAGGLTQIREVVSGNGNAASTASLDLEFGLGSATSATVQVLWPSGRTTVLSATTANQHLAISEPGFNPGPTIGQVGVTTVGSTPRTVTFGRVYSNPIVFALPPSTQESDVAVVRITNVQSDRFTLKIHEPRNTSHAIETVSWLVLEAGSWRLADGTRFEVGKLTTSALANVGNLATVTYPQPLRSTPLLPVVITNVQTNNDPTWVKTRQRNPTRSSFQVGLEVKEGAGTHGAETLGWLAMEPSRGRWSNKFYAAGTTPNEITHLFHRVELGQDLGAAPRLLAAQATRNGGNPAGLRYRSLGSDGFEVKIEEDIENDPEINHIAERVSYLAIGGTGTLQANVATADSPPTPDFSVTCEDRTCTFDASSSTDNLALPGFGYSWLFGSEPAVGKVVEHTFPSYGTHPVRLTVTDSQGQVAVLSRQITVDDVKLVATYVPRFGQARRSFTSRTASPALFDFFFDPNLGKFHEQPGQVCNRGQNNPTYLKIRIDTAATIDACTFQASWDPAPFTCTSGQVAFVNSGTEVILSTDDVNQNPATCHDFEPLDPLVQFNQQYWFDLEMTIDGVLHKRRIRFRPKSQVIHVNASDDTYVSALSPVSNFGSSSTVRVKRNGSDIKFAFWKLTVPTLLGTRTSARLQLDVQASAPIVLNLHRVCGTSWLENQLTWNSWGSLTGGSCGVFSTPTGFITGEPKKLDVTGQVLGAGAVAFGGETGSVSSGDLSFWSTESASTHARPKLVVTVQR